MKKFIITLVAAVALSASAFAMSYSSAREQALFLTDKMAYELNMTNDQFNAAYEINLDYFMNVGTYADIYGVFWQIRNKEMGYVLSPRQYHAYMLIEYFYRPLTYTNNAFSYPIYGYYAKNRFYRSAPAGYSNYRGENRFYDYSPYQGRTYYTPGNEPKPRVEPKPLTGSGQQGNTQPAQTTFNGRRPNIDSSKNGTTVTTTNNNNNNGNVTTGNNSGNNGNTAGRNTNTGSSTSTGGRGRISTTTSGSVSNNSGGHQTNTATQPTMTKKESVSEGKKEFNSNSTTKTTHRK